MTELPIAPVGRLLKNAGAARISDDAKVELAEVLEEFIVHEKDFEYIRENAQKTVERLYLDKNINIWLQIIEETIQGE